MLNRLASLAMSTSVLKALPGKLDIKRHSPSIHYVLVVVFLKFTIWARLRNFLEFQEFFSDTLNNSGFIFIFSTQSV